MGAHRVFQPSRLFCVQLLHGLPDSTQNSSSPVFDPRSSFHPSPLCRLLRSANFSLPHVPPSTTQGLRQHQPPALLQRCRLPPGPSTLHPPRPQPPIPSASRAVALPQRQNGPAMWLGRSYRSFRIRSGRQHRWKASSGYKSDSSELIRPDHQELESSS